MIRSRIHLHLGGIWLLVVFSLGVQLFAGFFFQAIGKGFPATMITMSRHLLFLLPLLIFLPRFFGILGLWAAFPISDALAFIFSVSWVAIELRKQQIPILSAENVFNAT